jgi:hypothetical protein
MGFDDSSAIPDLPPSESGFFIRQPSAFDQSRDPFAPPPIIDPFAPLDETLLMEQVWIEDF